MNNIQPGDSVQWINRHTGRRFTGTVLEVYDAVASVRVGSGRKWAELRRLTRIEPLAVLCDNEDYAAALAAHAGSGVEW